MDNNMKQCRLTKRHNHAELKISKTPSRDVAQAAHAKQHAIARLELC